MFSKADNGFSTERNCLWSVGNAVLCFGKQTNKQTNKNCVTDWFPSYETTFLTQKFQCVHQIDV